MADEDTGQTPEQMQQHLEILRERERAASGPKEGLDRLARMAREVERWLPGVEDALDRLVRAAHGAALAMERLTSAADAVGPNPPNTGTIDGTIGRGGRGKNIE